MARMRSTLLALLAPLGPLAILGCQKEQAAPPPAPPAVTVAQPIVREVMDFDQYTGRIMAVESVEVRARVRGYLDKVGFKDGDEVKKGQLLFQIDPRPFDATLQSAQGQVDVVKARRVKADADVKRYRELVPQGAATQQDLDKAIGELGEAEAGIRAAEAEVERAKLDVLYAKVTAPIDGLASRALLTAGNLIGAGGGGDELLTTVVSIDPIYVYFDVDQRAAQQYRKRALDRLGGQAPTDLRAMNIKFQFGLASEEGFPHEGVIDFIDNKVDSGTGTVAVRGTVPNPQRAFKPGFFARVRVPMTDNYKAILLSERAIGTQQGQKYVLVVDEKNAVAFRPVKLGAAQDDGLRVVTTGVAPGDRVVINGMQRARPGSTVNPTEGPMFVQPVMPAGGPAAKPPTTQQVTING